MRNERDANEALAVTSLELQRRALRRPHPRRTSDAPRTAAHVIVGALCILANIIAWGIAL